MEMHSPITNSLLQMSRNVCACALRKYYDSLLMSMQWINVLHVIANRFILFYYALSIS